MTLDIKSDDLHIVSIGSSRGLLHEALQIPRELIYDHSDDFSCGPLSDTFDQKIWKDMRDDYWFKTVKYLSAIGEDTFSDYLAMDIDKFQRANNIFLWLGPLLREQLFLAWTISFFDERKIDLNKLKLVEFGILARNGSPVESLGLMNPEQVRNVKQSASLPLTQQALLKSFWKAVVDNEPYKLLELLEQPDLSDLTKFNIKGFMARYPAADNGLNVWDYWLLEYCQKRGPVAARIIGHTMGQGMESSKYDWAGDAYLFYRLKRLGDSQLPYPLLELRGDINNMRSMEATITEVGKQVFEGRKNYVTLNGVDEWVGGVHLSSTKGSVWFFDGKKLRK